MESKLTKYSNGKETSEYIQIEKMTYKIRSKNLLLITEFDINENGHTIDNLEISCKL